MAMQKRMPYDLHPGISKSSRDGEQLKPPKTLLYCVVESRALGQAAWPTFVDQGIPALERAIGCFILDPPMGLQKAGVGASDDPWGLDNALRAINIVSSSCPAPFAIAMFSLLDLVTMQTALANCKLLERSSDYSRKRGHGVQPCCTTLALFVLLPLLPTRMHFEQ